MSTQSKYFWISVVFFGSAGIWLPIGLEGCIDKKVTFHSVPPNFTTYFISILFAGTIDYFLSQIRTLSTEGITNALFSTIGVWIVGGALVIAATFLSIFRLDFWALLVGIIGILISFRVWWVANVDNPAFTSNGATGGSTDKPLANG